jgi:hypothetical protein
VTPYERAGLSAAEVRAVSGLIAGVEASDSSAPWVAVMRSDVLAVVAALDRLVDAAPDRHGIRAARVESDDAAPGATP